MAIKTLVVDGHDGSGKTSIARSVAARLGFAYVKPYDGNLGDFIAWAWGTTQFDLADAVARAAVSRELALIDGAEGAVFDRHWLTMFTVLPEKYWANWG